MKTLSFLLLVLTWSHAAFSQQEASLRFLHDTLSPSQFIEIELVKAKPNLSSNCTWAYSSIKFTVQADGSLINITPAVGVPEPLKMPLIQAVSMSKGKWENRRGSPIDCILPVIIIPASRCPEERPFLVLQSGAQMLKYKGQYVVFPNNNFGRYNTDTIEGVIFSPILLHDSTVN